mgnify:CR=1 FL=1
MARAFFAIEGGYPSACTDDHHAAIREVLMREWDPIGVADIPQSRVVRKGRLQPGRMFLIDTAEGRIVEDDEIKRGLATAEPYEQWLANGLVELKELPEREHVVFSHQSVLRRQQVFGYTHEELKIILAPMAKSGLEAIGSMGTEIGRAHV